MTTKYLRLFNRFYSLNKTIQKRYFACPPDDVILQWEVDSLKSNYKKTEVDYCKIGSLLHKLSNNIPLNDKDKTDLIHIKQLTVQNEDEIKKDIKLFSSLTNSNDYIERGTIPHVLRILELRLELSRAKNALQQFTPSKSKIDDTILNTYKKHRQKDIIEHIQFYEDCIKNHDLDKQICEDQIKKLKNCEDIYDRNI